MHKMKDLAEKYLFTHNDVFAEVFNKLVFYGTGLVIREDELEDVRPGTLYEPSSDYEVREQERDVVKFWRREGVILSLLGLENQTRIDKYMMLRVMGYEGADYRYQLIQREEDIAEARRQGNRELAERLRKRKCYPVITVVLYYGKQRWKKYKSLYECLELPEGLRGVVEDRHLNVIEMCCLSDNEEAKLDRDLLAVVDMLKQMNSTGKYIPKHVEGIRHIEAVILMARALSRHKEDFTDMVNRLYELKAEGKENIQLFDLVEAVRKATDSEWEARRREIDFYRTYKFMKSIGVSPENLEKYRAMYPDIQPAD